MNQESDNDPRRPDDGFEEIDPETDDAIIGLAFRRSLVVIVAVAIVAGIVWLWRSRPVPESEGISIAVEAPEKVADARAPSVRFTDVTESSGVDFVHFNGAYGEKLLPETMGSGVAIVDFDNDGDQDLVFANGTAWPGQPHPDPMPTLRVYRNDGTGRFEDATSQTKLEKSFYGQGVAVADYNGDGWVDLFVAAVGTNRLWSNRGGVFEEVTDRAGVGGSSDEWTSCASFFDYDGDGDLDLFVGNYVRWSKNIDVELDYRLTGVGRAYGPPQNYEGTFPRLYRNDGDDRFTDVSAEAGIMITNPSTGLPMAKTLGLSPVDLDHDGAMDLFVANDTVRNFLYHNLGDGRLEEVGELFGVAYGPQGNATGAMGIDFSYFRNDGDLGFAVGNFANEMSSLYVSQGDPTFYVDESISEGFGTPSRRHLSFGLFFFDYDLDGRMDLLQANGHLEQEIAQVDPSQSYRQPVQLFWNAGEASETAFVVVPTDELGALSRPIAGRAAAYGDLDGDGDLDIVVTQTGEPPVIVRNDQELGHHWLRVKLVGRPPNRDAIGARVDLRTSNGAQRRQVMPTRSYMAQVELPLTFGLGDAASVENLSITWPDGSAQSVVIDDIDCLVVIEQEN